MKRSIMKSLGEWELSPIRSPLLLLGARQVGKTTTLKEFSKLIGEQVIEINFWRDKNDRLKSIFNLNGDAFDILNELTDYFSLDKINTKKDVLFIDEIQDCPSAYSSLKSFKEQIPELRVVATGSYLRLFLGRSDLVSHPVGCVDTLFLKPLSFDEFLENYDEKLYAKYNKLNRDEFKITESLHEKLMIKLYEYFFTGGMPEIVYLFFNLPKNTVSRKKVRHKQQDIIRQYIEDFQKYGKSIHIKKIDKLFQNIPKQLEEVQVGESVKRFYYKELGKNSNYDLFHWPFDYLENAGLIIRSFYVSRMDLPFKVHEKKEQRNIFKCFYFDIGLLQATLHSPIDCLFKELGSYKGYIAENYVAQELFYDSNEELISYKKNSKADSAEVEFVIKRDDGKIIPIEVKSSLKSLRSKSLDSFVKQYSPEVAYKLTPGRNQLSEKYTSLPLYMVRKILN